MSQLGTRLEVVRKAASLNDIIVARLIKVLSEGDVAAHGGVHNPCGLANTQWPFMLVLGCHWM